MKHHRNSDTKKANRDHTRTTALKRSVMDYWGGGLNSFTRASSPSVTDVVQTLSWLFGSHDHPLTRQRIFMVNREIKLNNYEEAKTRTRQIQCVA